jgi:hypothetical protein
MPRRKQNLEDISEAMKVFLQELPDPKRSKESTIREDFLIKDEKVTLQAQKIKGAQGMCWNIKNLKKE